MDTKNRKGRCGPADLVGRVRDLLQIYIDALPFLDREWSVYLPEVLDEYERLKRVRPMAFLLEAVNAVVFSRVEEYVLKVQLEIVRIDRERRSAAISELSTPETEVIYKKHPTKTTIKKGGKSI